MYTVFTQGYLACVDVEPNAKNWIILSLQKLCMDQTPAWIDFFGRWGLCCQLLPWVGYDGGFGPHRPHKVNAYASSSIADRRKIISDRIFSLQTLQH